MGPRQTKTTFTDGSLRSIRKVSSVAEACSLEDVNCSHSLNNSNRSLKSFHETTLNPHKKPRFRHIINTPSEAESVLIKDDESLAAAHQHPLKYCQLSYAA